MRRTRTGRRSGGGQAETEEAAAAQVEAQVEAQAAAQVAAAIGAAPGTAPANPRGLWDAEAFQPHPPAAPRGVRPTARPGGQQRAQTARTARL